MNKRGLSGIITVVLLVLLILVAIGLIWVLVLPVFSDVGVELNTASFTTDFEIVEKSVVLDQENSILEFNLQRKVGDGEVIGVNVIIKDDLGNAEVFREDFIINELETRKVSINYGVGLGVIESFEVAPIFIIDGQEKIGGVVDSYELTGDETSGISVNINNPSANAFLGFANDLTISAGISGEDITSCSYSIEDVYNPSVILEGSLDCLNPSVTIPGYSLTPGRYRVTVTALTATEQRNDIVNFDYVGNNFAGLLNMQVSSGQVTIPRPTEGYALVEDIANKDLALWLRMDDTSSDNLQVYDLSANNHRAVVDSGISKVSGRYGEAFSFTTNGLKIALATDNGLDFGNTDDFTVLAWVKGDPVNLDRNIVTDISATSQWGWSLTSAYGSSPSANRRAVFKITGNNGISGQCLVSNTTVINLLEDEWYLVYGGFSASTNQIFCGAYKPSTGDLVTPLPVTYTGSQFSGNNNNIKIAEQISVPSWQGEIDDVMIFNRALSPTDIRAMFIDTNFVKAYSGEVRGYTVDASGYKVSNIQVI